MEKKRDTVQNLNNCVAHLENAGSILVQLCLSTDQLIAQQETQNINSNAKQVLREERELISEQDWDHFVNFSLK